MMNNKTDLFENYPIPKSVAKLAIPTVMASIVMVLYSLADTYFVGLLNDPLETSAVTFAAPVLLAFNAINNLFGVGTSSVMSRSLGVKDYNTVKKSSAFGIYSSIIFGLLFSLLAFIFNKPLLSLLGADSISKSTTQSYLFWTVVCGAIPSILNVVMANIVRAEGSSLHASVGTMSGCLLNIILDPLFILPKFLGMGAAGAGLATFISNSVATLYYVVLTIIKHGNTYVCLNPKMAIPTKYILKEVFGVGIPASIQNILNVLGMTILNNKTAAYGAEAVSAMGISHKLSLVPLYFSMGAAQGVMPLIGYNFASGNKARMKEAIRYTQKLLVSSTAIAGVIFYILSGELVALFMKNNLIVEYGTGFMHGFSLAILFLAFDFLAVAIFQACGMGRKSLYFALARKLVLEIPGFMILNLIFGMYGLAYGQVIAELTLSVIAYFEIEKIIKNVREPQDIAQT